MTFPLEWIFVALLCLYSLWLSARYIETDEALTEERRLRMTAEAELRVERRRCLELEAEEAATYNHVRELWRKNRHLAEQSGIRLNGEIYADMRFYEGGDK
jgi:hypothetical protein